MDVWRRSTIAYYYVNFSWGVILWQLFISPFSTDDAEYPDFTCTSLIYFKLLLVQVTDSICFAHKGLPGSFYTRYDQFHTKSYCMTNMKKKKKKMKWNILIGMWICRIFFGLFVFFLKKGQPLPALLQETVGCQWVNYLLGLFLFRQNKQTVEAQRLWVQNQCRKRKAKNKTKHNAEPQISRIYLPRGRNIKVHKTFLEKQQCTTAWAMLSICGTSIRVQVF